MMRRGDAAPAAAATLETQIDLRIIQRWMLAHAVAAKPESQAQIALLSRANQLAAATGGVEEALKAGAAAPSRTQADAMGQIRKLSFDLPAEPKDSAQLDELCKKL